MKTIETIFSYYRRSIWSIVMFLLNHYRRSMWSVVMLILVTGIGCLFFITCPITDSFKMEIENLLFYSSTSGSFLSPNKWEFVITLILTIILVDLYIFYWVRIFKKPNPIKMSMTSMFFWFFIQPLIGIIAGILFFWAGQYFDDVSFSLDWSILFFGQLTSLLVVIFAGFNAEFDLIEYLI